MRAACSSTDAFYGSLGPRWPDRDISSPETAGYLRTLRPEPPAHVAVADDEPRCCSKPAWGSYRAAWGPFEMPGNPTRGLARVTELAGQKQRGAPISVSFRQLGGRLRQSEPVALLGVATSLAPTT